MEKGSLQFAFRRLALRFNDARDVLGNLNMCYDWRRDEGNSHLNLSDAAPIARSHRALVHHNQGLFSNCSHNADDAYGTVLTAQGLLKRNKNINSNGEMIALGPVEVTNRDEISRKQRSIREGSC